MKPHTVLCLALLALEVLTYKAQAKTVWETIQGRSDMMILTAALKTIKATDGLNDKNLVTTFIAPTDNAFNKLLKQYKLTKQDLLASPDLMHILLYHTLPGSALVTDKLTPAFTSYATGLEGATVKLRKSGTTVLVQAPYSSGKLVEKNVKAEKAIINVVDTVLLPTALDTSKTIYNTLKSLPELSTFAYAVSQSSWLAQATASSTAATVFAPTNEALAAYFLQLNISASDVIDNKPLLDWVIAYHVAVGKYTSANLPLAVQTANVNTIGWWLPLSVRKNANGISVRGMYNSATITKGDYAAGAGAVHVLDTVLAPPKLPSTIREALYYYPSIQVYTGLQDRTVIIGIAARNPSTAWTFMAPNDDAFINTVGILQQAGIPFLSNTSHLIEKFLDYHTLINPVRVESLKHGDVLDTVLGATIKVEIVKGEVFLRGVGVIKGLEWLPNRAKVLVSNIPYGKSLIQVLDGVLIPPMEW